MIPTDASSNTLYYYSYRLTAIVLRWYSPHPNSWWRSGIIADTQGCIYVGACHCLSVACK